MQSVNFKSIEAFLDFLPDDELNMVKVFRKLIFDCIPGITEKLSYNVPFYKKHKGMFFIWPVSVLWGKKQSYKGVRFGFQQGYLMADEIHYLERGNRKQVYWRTFKNIQEIDIALLRAYLFEADLIDKNLKKNK